jgi:hypothetical protein
MASVKSPTSQRRRGMGHPGLFESCEWMLPLYAAEVSSTAAFRADLRHTGGRHSARIPENARADFSVDDGGE